MRFVMTFDFKKRIYFFMLFVCFVWGCDRFKDFFLKTNLETKSI
ncbi:hypothetical protein LEP1GSC170_1927 [Leptospira interrogans serovar Bataviae str. HAI135]|nr:hypothetical protein LEP1GSC170_1927 [Leptospira interrogans serovar Bataviae str. HAI135]